MGFDAGLMCVKSRRGPAWEAAGLGFRRLPMKRDALRTVRDEHASLSAMLRSMLVMIERVAVSSKTSSLASGGSPIHSCCALSQGLGGLLM